MVKTLHIKSTLITIFLHTCQIDTIKSKFKLKRLRMQKHNDMLACLSPPKCDRLTVGGKTVDIQHPILLTDS